MRLRNETREWILRQTYIWRKEELPWDQHGKIPVRNGLVDPLTGELEPARPDHFCSWRIDIDYDKAATCPWWETMVADVFGDRDRDERDALAGVVQECIGAALIDKKPRSLSKALVFWGNENRAKSGILDVVGGLFGSAISSSIGSLEGNHGLMPFRKRAPWILHEAFGGQWHFSSVVKAIVTQEPVLINIKNGPMLTRVVYAPIFWATNHQPQFKEPTKAIVSRMIVIEVTRQFDEANPIGAAAEAFKRKFSKPGEFIVATELPGVLNWALKGLQRALERGSIATTASIDETANLIHRDSNLVAGFLDECIEFDPNARLRIADFNLAHSAWWLELKGESRRLPSGEAVNKALKAAGEPRVALDRAELRDNVTRYYGGVRLNKAGLRYHRAAYDGRLFEGKKSPTATNPGAPGANVNDDMPASWDTRKSIIAMRKAFARVKSSDDRSR
jgi:phage/plasmid-associated DNA primase